MFALAQVLAGVLRDCKKLIDDHKAVMATLYEMGRGVCRDLQTATTRRPQLEEESMNSLQVRDCQQITIEQA